MYFCEACNYTTEFSSNFCNHKKTKKHLKNLDINNLTLEDRDPERSDEIPKRSIKDLKNSKKTIVVNSKFICEFCEEKFSHKTNYYRHRKKCDAKHSDYKVLKKELEMEKKEKELIIKIEKEKTELLNNFMANANVLLNKANDNTKITAQTLQTVSVSALKYANEKFKNAPALLPLENFTINNLDFDNEEDKEKLIELLIYNAKQKSLDKLLGDQIIKVYKKENPATQSFHVTDCSRLNYIVRELIENALIWSIDKNGIKICSSIVKPLIEKCINILLDHQKELLRLLGQGHLNKQQDIETIIELLMSIDKGSLETDINKYIAPYFNLNKS